MQNLKLVIAGFFMGLANLVPGVSGGTMVLALGCYDDFIQSFSDLTRFNFSKKAIITVVSLFGMAGLTILSFAGIIQFLMERYYSNMMALFIGLTLGGIPIIYKLIQINKSSIFGFSTGLFIMVMMAFFFTFDFGSNSIILYFIGGILGSAAMILPGISGSYLLLILGIYLPIIRGINDFKYALKDLNYSLMIDLGVNLVLPVGLGVLLGIIILSNILKYLLKKHSFLTHGFLLGLLVGSVLGLFPFKAPNFDKLVKNAININGIEVIQVYASGWDSRDSRIMNSLEKIENKNVKVDIFQFNNNPEFNDIFLAELRNKSAVLINYKKSIPVNFRKSANLRPKVNIINVPDTSFSIYKLIVAVCLCLFGFLLTFYLSKLDINRE